MDSQQSFLYGVQPLIRYFARLPGCLDPGDLLMSNNYGAWRLVEEYQEANLPAAERSASVPRQAMQGSFKAFKSAEGEYLWFFLACQR